MKERSIVLKPFEVRGILDGTITKLWRVVKPQPIEHDGIIECGPAIAGSMHALVAWLILNKCPLGPVGSKVWGKEAWHGSLIGEAGTSIDYKATCAQNTSEENPWESFTSDPDAYEWVAKHYTKTWASPVTMPRWASRITLTLEAVEVEKVNGEWMWVYTVQKCDLAMVNRSDL